MAKCVIGIAIRKDVLGYCLEHNCILDSWKDRKEEFREVKKGDKCFIYYVPEEKLYGIFEAKGEAIEFPETPFRFSEKKLDLKVELEKKEDRVILNAKKILEKANVKFKKNTPDKRVFDEEIIKIIEEKPEIKEKEEVDLKRLRLENSVYEFKDIIGLKSLKNYFEKLKKCWEKRCIDIKYSNVRLCQGFFLFGPPGTGKTLFAKTVAKEFEDASYCEISPSIIAGYPGEAEKEIEQDLKGVFEIFKHRGKGVIIVDEADGLFSSRERVWHSSVMARVIPVFLTQINNLVGDPQYRNVPIFLFAISNCPEAVDPAFLRPGRFENLYYVGLPKDDEEYIELFKYYLNQYEEMLEKDVVEKKENLEKLSKLLKERIAKIREDEKNKKSIHPDFGKYSPADIKKIVDDAALEACYNDSKINLGILEKIINSSHSSVTNEILQKNEEFKKSHPHTKEA